MRTLPGQSISIANHAGFDRYMKHDAFDTLALAPHIKYNALDMPASTAHVNFNVFDMLALASGLKEYFVQCQS